MVSLKIRRIGDELGVVLPPEMLERLGVGEGGELQLLDNGHYRLLGETVELEEVMVAFENVCNRYGDTLRRLAE